MNTGKGFPDNKIQGKSVFLLWKGGLVELQILSLVDFIAMQSSG